MNYISPGVDPKQASIIPLKHRRHYSPEASRPVGIKLALEPAHMFDISNVYCKKVASFMKLEVPGQGKVGPKLQPLVWLAKVNAAKIVL